MSVFVIPILVIVTISYAIVKNVNAYDNFVFGAKSSFDLVLSTFPYIVAIFIALEIFTTSGLSQIIANFLSPFFNLFGIPKELCELVLIKPFSGCGSLAALENIFEVYGVDSYIARAGCAVCGSGEAIFYVTAVYFSKTKVKKFRYAIPVALISNFIGAVVGCAICKVM